MLDELRRRVDEAENVLGVIPDTRPLIERTNAEHEEFEREHGAKVAALGVDAFRELLREEIEQRKQAKGN